MVYQQANQPQQASSQQSQRSNVVASHQNAGQHHNSSQLGQYMGQQQHQQMQSHGSSAAAAAAAYYQQQAHLYQPAYGQAGHTQQQEQAQSHPHQQQQTQQHQQHSTPDYHHHQHHHHPGSNIGVTGPAPTASVAGVHSNVHNTPSSALNHANWSPSVGSLAPQTHHPVVTDHSTMAYMGNPYQSHNTNVSDHHRNSNGTIASQGLNASHQATSYSVDALYNTPSADAAAVAAFAAAAHNYNNYNSAFFQTSNNGPHSQTGHPTQAAISNFWNHNPTPQQQQRPAHSQTATNQSSVQSRQPIVSAEQTATNYLHDPRMFYARPTYGQGLPNIGQTPQHQTQPPQSADMMHHRMQAGLPQLHQMFSHHDVHQVTHQTNATSAVQHTQLPIGNQAHQSTPSSTTTTNAHQSTPPVQQNQSSTVNDPMFESSTQVTTRQLNKTGPQLSSTQKQNITSSENDKLSQQQASSHIRTTSETEFSKRLDSSVPSQPSHDPSSPIDVVDNVFQSSKDSVKRLRDPVGAVQEQQSSNKYSAPQNVIKSEPYQPPYQKSKQQASDSSTSNTTTSTTTPSSRNIFRSQQQEERSKPLSQQPQQQNDNSKRSQNDERDYRLNQEPINKPKSPPPSATVVTVINAGEQNTPDQLGSLEESMASLAVSSPRKTTWASIASQPAKVTQPKSLKSKIAGSTSVLSNAKHLAVVSLDTSSLDSKNGINPAIKSSVSAATTSIQRSSMPPPITKLPSVAASLKLDLLGDAIGQNNKISWPAVNASANLQNELLKEKEALAKQQSSNNQVSDTNNRRSNHNDDGRNMRDRHDSDDHQGYKDHNHNQGVYQSNKMGNSYDMNHQDSHQPREPWANRRFGGGDQNRYRHDSDRDDMPNEYKEDLREVLNSRRNDSNQIGGGGYHRQNNNNNGSRPIMGNQFRDREDPGFRGGDRGPPGHMKRGGGPPPMMMDRNKPLPPRANDNYQPPSRYSQYNNRFDSRDGPPPPSRHQDRNSRPPYQPAFRERENSGRDRDRDSRNSRDDDSPISGGRLDMSANNDGPQHQPAALNPANYNPKVFNLEPVNARYFIIKSYSGDDIYRSIKYAIWCSTNHGNKKLDEAFRQQQASDGPIYLFFSVNGSGHFCGMAQMTSAVDFDSSTGVWAQSKWQGEFSVKWIHVKDVPNNALRHITLENNEDKPVTNSRDTQEVPSEKGKAVLKIIHNYVHSASIFDQFQHYERRQEEDRLKRSSGHGPISDHHGPPLDHHGGGPRPMRDDDRSERMHGGGGLGGNGAGGQRFGGRPYINPRPHNEHFRGGDRGGGRLGGGPPPPHSHRPHLSNRDAHLTDKLPYRENGPVRNSIKLTQ